MRDTAVAVSMNQMAQGVINNVDPLNSPDRDTLLQSLTTRMVWMGSGLGVAGEFLGSLWGVTDGAAFQVYARYGDLHEP